MYDKLVKQLRNESDCDEYEDYVAAMLGKAADAIEELSSHLDDFERMCLPLKENRLYKYSDGSFVEVFLILSSEPLKGE